MDKLLLVLPQRDRLWIDCDEESVAIRQTDIDGADHAVLIPYDSLSGIINALSVAITANANRKEGE